MQLNYLYLSLTSWPQSLPCLRCELAWSGQTWPWSDAWSIHKSSLCRPRHSRTENTVLLLNGAAVQLTLCSPAEWILHSREHDRGLSAFHAALIRGTACITIVTRIITSHLHYSIAQIHLSSCFSSNSCAPSSLSSTLHIRRVGFNLISLWSQTGN